VAFSQGKFADAIEAFLAADKLWPDPSLSYNLARAYEQLNDDAGAMRYYREYLDRTPEAQDRAEVEAKIAGFAQRIAETPSRIVRLQSAPIGASAFLDNQPVGVTPIEVQTGTGFHRLRFELDGYTKRELTFTLSHDSPPLPIHATLEPDPGVASRASRQPSLFDSEPGTADASAGSTVERTPLLRHVGVAAMLSGVAAFGGAIAFEVMRSDAARTARDETEQIRFASALDTMESRQTWARVLLGVGGGLTALGITLLVLSRNRDVAPAHGSASARLSLDCAPGTCNAHLRGSF
jgi:tetratricopeptide (TPR) repeat protein